MGWKTKAKYAQMRAALIEVLRNKGHFHYRPPTETPSAAEFEAALIAEGHRIQKTGRKGLALIAQAMGVVVVPVDGQRVALAKPKLKPAVPKKAPASSDFLETYEWRRLRMEALKKYGRRCMCCGATPESGAVMNVDHIKPRLHFPELALDLMNLQVLCGACNHGKGNWDQTDWRDLPTVTGTTVRLVK